MTRPPDHAPYLVGLTGGIASGKSAVAAEFGKRGIPVVDADQIAREVVAPGEPLLDEIRLAFGSGVIAADGSLDRAALRALVFADGTARARLNALTHPAIRRRMFDRARAAAGPYVVLEVPLLVEGGLYRDVDRVLVVDCPPELQRTRLIARDGGSPAQADAILAAQASRSERLSLADDIVTNTGSLWDLERSVGLLHERYLELARARSGR